ncbi:hypothetical protein VUR80DRAFT_10166 [Thermomyces stellatus]
MPWFCGESDKNQAEMDVKDVSLFITTRHCSLARCKPYKEAPTTAASLMPVLAYLFVENPNLCCHLVQPEIIPGHQTCVHICGGPPSLATSS